MLVDARRAFELEPPGSPLHPLAAMMLGVAELLAGSPEDGEPSSSSRRRCWDGRRARLAAHVALAQLSLLAADARRTRRPTQCAAERARR